MASLNRATSTVPSTHEGAPAKRISTLDQLRRTTLACLLWEDSFYEDGKAIAERIAELVHALPGREVNGSRDTSKRADEVETCAFIASKGACKAPGEE